ncbi:hypothetical protein CSOJ01_09026 [Colletotrichum sojae]|uniref:Uncharacterized protein n=1 Tax=Colletotrichum sojae TaxID=2175907 RepID=A0A8H6J422_9PEZI|nr:hypothetical protein CSOJ01_09026 [Colletotrichum sojae]
MIQLRKRPAPAAFDIGADASRRRIEEEDIALAVGLVPARASVVAKDDIHFCFDELGDLVLRVDYFDDMFQVCSRAVARASPVLKALLGQYSGNSGPTPEPGTPEDSRLAEDSPYEMERFPAIVHADFQARPIEAIHPGALPVPEVPPKVRRDAGHTALGADLVGWCEPADRPAVAALGGVDDGGCGAVSEDAVQDCRER